MRYFKTDFLLLFDITLLNVIEIWFTFRKNSQHSHLIQSFQQFRVKTKIENASRNSRLRSNHSYENITRCDYFCNDAIPIRPMEWNFLRTTLSLFLLSADASLMKNFHFYPRREILLCRVNWWKLGWTSHSESCFFRDSAMVDSIDWTSIFKNSIKIQFWKLNWKIDEKICNLSRIIKIFMHWFFFFLKSTTLISIKTILSTGCSINAKSKKISVHFFLVFRERE